MTSFNLKPISNTSDKDWITTFLNTYWGSIEIVSRGIIIKADQLPGFIAYTEKEKIGLVTYKFENDKCEIVSLNSVKEGIGIGTKLVQAVIEESKKQHLHKVWLTTTNDNTKALRFYQKQGFEIMAIYKNAVVEARKLKPQIPLSGIDNIPIKDEIELELILK